MRNHTQQPVDMMSLGFTKVAGFYPWTGYSADFDWNYTHFWKHTIRAQYHMNGDDVIGTLSEGGGDWGHGKQEWLVKLPFLGWGKATSLIEQQHYKSNNQELAIGYVKNRTFNISTEGCDVTFTDDHLNSKITIVRDFLKNKNSFVIEQLKNKTKYYVDWYSFEKADYIKTNNNGELKLMFPDLYPIIDPISGQKNPVVWFVVHQNQNIEFVPYQDTLVNNYKYQIFQFQQIENDTASAEFVNAIYPNPFSSLLIVNSVIDDWLLIKTVDGKIIKQQEVKKGKNMMLIEELPNGLFLFELKNQRFITKLEKL